MAKQSYSKIAKQLAAKEKKYSKLFENARNEREKVSAQMMLDRVNSRKEELASENQIRADQMESNTFGYGGITKKRSYLNGGMTKKSVYARGGFTDPPQDTIVSPTGVVYFDQNNPSPKMKSKNPYDIWYEQKYGDLPGYKKALYNPTNRENNFEFQTWKRANYNTAYVSPSEVQGNQSMIGQYHVLPSEVGGKKSMLNQNYNPLNNNFRTVSDNIMDEVMNTDFSPQKQEAPSTLDPKAMDELGLNQKPKVSKGSSKANYNNQDVLDYLAANPEFAEYLESKGLTPTLDNIKALQGAIGTEVDNQGGANTMAALEKYKADYEAALAQGATPEEAATVAATNQEVDKTIDGKTAKSGIDWMQGNFTPSTMDKAMQGIGIGGSFMDNIARARQINRTRPMNAPMYMEAPSIETRMNISPQLNEARNAQAIFNRGIDRSAMSGGQGMAAKASAYAGRLNAANKMYGEKSNRETALRNRQRQLTAQTANQNRQMYGQYRNNLVNFENSRLGAMAQNTANFGQDLSSIGSDYMKNIRSPKMQLEAYKPLFGDIMSRNFTGLPG
jgi:hypothetical protein